jgi:RNA polymerase sigma-70 factor (ECF subfamily)
MVTVMRLIKESVMKETFLQAFDEYGDAIFRFCMVKTGNKELSEDLTQEAFMRYWQALRDGKEMSNTRSYLYTIARNLVIDWYRKAKEQSLDMKQEAGYDPHDEKSFDAEFYAEHQEVLGAIEELDEKDKDILLLRYVEDLPPKDIANILHTTTNIVSVRINRAMKRLQKQMKI